MARPATLKLSKLKILYLNAQSLLSRTKTGIKTSTIIAQMISMHKPHVLAFSETWLAKDKTPPTFKDYEVISRKDREDTGEGRGGGVILYAYKTIKAAPVIPQITTASSQVCGLKFQDFHLFCVYKSPSQSDEDDKNFYADLSEINHDQACYTGDFNARLAFGAAERPDKRAKILHEFVDAAGLTQHVRDPTRQSRILDLVLTTSAGLVKQAPEVFPTPPLDHRAILFEIDMPVPPPEITIETVDHKKLDWQAINDEVEILLSQLKPSIQNDREAEEYSAFLHGVVKDVFTQHLNATKTKKKIRPNQPYVNGTIIKMEKAVKRLYGLARQHNNDQAWDRYVRQVAELNREIQKQQLIYEQSLINNYAINPAGFHQYLKRHKNEKTQIGPLVVDGNYVTEDKPMADALVNHYKSVCEPEVRFRGEFRSHAKTMPKFWITTNMVKNKIMALPKGKAPGPDLITNTTLKKLVTVVSPHLATLFNYCLHNGLALDHWMDVWINPIPKQGKPPELPSSQRPISLLQTTWKLFESIVLDKWVAQMKKTGFMSEFQHATKKGASPITNLLQYLRIVTDNVEDKAVTHVASFDLSNAFDKSSFSSLVSSCLDSGMDPEFAKIMNNFLENRRIRVKMASSLSEPVNFSSGVPQGSCSSSHQFCCMIQGVVTGLNCKYSLFCDDIKLYKACKTMEDVKSFQQDIRHFNTWMRSKGLKVNKDKSYHQVFNYRDDAVGKATFRIGRNRLATVEEGKDLGVLVDSNLQFYEHMKNLVKGVRVRAIMVKKNIMSRDPKLLTKIWMTHISPPAEFGVGVFAMDNPKVDNDGQPRGIVKLQRELCRIQSRFFRGVQFDESCKGPPGILRKMRHLKMGLIWSVMHGKTVLRPEEVFTFTNRNTLRTGSGMAAIMPKTTSNAKRRFLGAAAINQWNAIPAAQRTNRSKVSFKRYLKFNHEQTSFNYHLNSNERFRYENQI